MHDTAYETGKSFLSCIGNLVVGFINMALQQNLWGPPGGSGRDPSVWYSAI